ncbi:hypothetical protein [Sulfuriflexus mobilis]|uniref:hypothetical protein n=1 Tax=Sulfuriflexus mobilis TaxID=1811807 RepID=UPI000F848E04|nr:hypothetical protein [Sulfuriflexus mobilis]
MPYFVYRFFPEKTNQLELQDSHDSYRDAKQQVKDMRAAYPNEDLNHFRLVFADNERQARILLTTRREKPRIEEWEN